MPRRFSCLSIALFIEIANLFSAHRNILYVGIRMSRPSRFRELGLKCKNKRIPQSTLTEIP
jgi:hypothetical protein